MCERKDRKTEMAIRIDELMKEWGAYSHSQKQWENAIFVEDGPFPYYERQKTKILFIGRELYGKRNEEDPLTIKYWEEREGVIKLGVFQSRLLYLAYGIQHGECSYDEWERMDEARKLDRVFATDEDNTFSYAFINASKIFNEKSSHVEEEFFGTFVNDKVNRAFFVREIELLAPDIIVSGNLNDLGFWSLEGLREKLEQYDLKYNRDDCFVWKYKINDKTEIPLLDGRHFSAPGDTFERFYEPICTVARELLKINPFKI